VALSASRCFVWESRSSLRDTSCFCAADNSAASRSASASAAAARLSAADSLATRPPRSFSSSAVRRSSADVNLACSSSYVSLRDACTSWNCFCRAACWWAMSVFARSSAVAARFASVSSASVLVS